MKIKKGLLPVMILGTVFVLLLGCEKKKEEMIPQLSSPSSNNKPSNNKPPNTQLANPASVHCKEIGGKIEIRKDETGGEIGYCLFEDNSECEEWSLFKGECKKGDRQREN